MKINKEMIEAILNAMVHEIRKKGKANAMVTIERIEHAMHEQGVTFFVPLRTALSALINKSVVTYYMMNNGRLVYGLSRKAQQHYMPEFFTGGEQNDSERANQ